MEKQDRGALSEDMKSLREMLEKLPQAQNEEQAEVLSALDGLMASLDRLSKTVEAMKTDKDD